MSEFVSKLSLGDRILPVMKLGVLLALLVNAPAVFGAVEPVMISVKLVKKHPQHSTATPRMKLPAQWQIVNRPYYSGENKWEIFFEIETHSSKPSLASVAMIAPGIQAARIIVGKSDVQFKQQGDEVTFQLVDDRSRGQLMQVSYQSPRGGHVVQLIHNWKMRRNEQYLQDPYPEDAIRAIPNYLLAAQEILRVMGDMGPGPSKRFDGELVLMGSEVAATRGHMDFPPHVHIMHYQFVDIPGETRRWFSRLVPHFYMNSAGRIVQNKYDVLAGVGTSGLLGIGDSCQLRDSAGRPILELVITKDALEFQRPDGRVYSLRPDPKEGAAKAVYGHLGSQAICRVRAEDDAARGKFHYKLERLHEDTVTETFEDGYRYDPFTAVVVGKE